MSETADEKPLTDEEREILNRYHAHGHAIQTGIKVLLGCNATHECEPKHLRVGISLSKTDHAGLVELLIEKGLFTRQEYFQKMEKMAAKERQNYQDRVRLVLGQNFTIG